MQLWACGDAHLSPTRCPGPSRRHLAPSSQAGQGGHTRHLQPRRSSLADGHAHAGQQLPCQWVTAALVAAAFVQLGAAIGMGSRAVNDNGRLPALHFVHIPRAVGGPLAGGCPATHASALCRLGCTCVLEGWRWGGGTCEPTLELPTRPSSCDWRQLQFTIGCWGLTLGP